MKRLIGVLAFSVSVASFAELGSTTSTQTLPGLNQITKQYHSCAVSLAQVADSLGRPVDEAKVVRTKLEAKFGEDKLQLEQLVGLDVDGASVVFAPEQSFLTGRIDTLHKTVSSMASFTGHYVMRERNASSDANWFSDSKFAVIELKGQSFHLVPVEQYAPLLSVLSGKSTDWNFEASPTDRWAAVAAANSRPKAGVVKTGRGTVYVFGENGSVTVYGRNGEKLTHVAAPAPSKKDAPYASHKAILARQGVVIESEDPVVAIEIALQNNPGAMAKFRDEKKLSPAVVGVHQYELAKIARQFDEGKEAYQRNTSIADAVRFADGGGETLPPFLRWRKISDPSLKTAQGGVYRVISPFLFFRRRENVGYVSPEVRLTSASSLHLQAAHANLGNFALTLEKQGLLVGGHLSFEYDVGTGLLKKVRLEGNGLISLAHSRGQALKLSDADLQWLSQELRNSLPSGTEVEIIPGQR